MKNMNTRQKLTLSIAAIFMITLTIVGVTYAYFVTRINTTNEATAVIKTANVSVQYGDGTELASLTNVEPGETVYKLFTVTNKSTVKVPFAIQLTEVSEEGDTPVRRFVHTLNSATTNTVGSASYTESVSNTSTLLNDTLTTECYMGESITNLETYEADVEANGDSATSTSPNCYAGNRYNNILASVYSVTYGTTDGETIEALNDLDDATLKTTLEGLVGTGTQIGPDMYAPANSATLTPVVFFGSSAGSLQYIDPKTNDEDTVYYYVLKIEYVNNHKNQNIENEAVANFKVDIADQINIAS